MAVFVEILVMLQTLISKVLMVSDTGKVAHVSISTKRVL